MLKTDHNQNTTPGHPTSIAGRLDDAAPAHKPNRLANLIARDEQVQRESVIRHAHRLRMREFVSRLKPAS